MAKVLNMYHINKNIPDDAVYVGRPSMYGNHFTHLESKKGHRDLVYVETRAESVARYREWVTTSTDKRAAQIRKSLPSLKGKDLVCWCNPLACHADVLLELANA